MPLRFMVFPLKLTVSRLAYRVPLVVADSEPPWDEMVDEAFVLVPPERHPLELLGERVTHPLALAMVAEPSEVDSTPPV